MGYEPGPECRICKGRCCHEHGCSLSPADLSHYLSLAGFSPTDFSKETLVSLLTHEKYGLFAIEYFWHNERQVYYLRMKHKCYTFVGVDAMGECIALTDEGCMLSMEDRPRGGRDLKSSPDFKCHQEYTSEEMSLDWLPYSDTLQEIYTEYEAIYNADGTFDKCDRDYFEYLKKQKLRETR